VLCCCFTFPGRWPSGRSKQRPHSQWRDRAGFAPDFPVMPLVGTQTRAALYHDHAASDKSMHSPVNALPRRSHERLRNLQAERRYALGIRQRVSGGGSRLEALIGIACDAQRPPERSKSLHLGANVGSL